MKNPCKNCGKYTSELDDFGYCKKCSTKLFKQSRHTTIEQIKIEKNMKGAGSADNSAECGDDVYSFYESRSMIEIDPTKAW